MRPVRRPPASLVCFVGLCAAAAWAVGCSDSSAGKSGSSDAALAPETGSPLPPPTVTGSYGGNAFSAKGVGLTRRNWQGDGGPSEVYGGASFMITQNADPCATQRDVNDPALTFVLRSGLICTSPECPLSPGDFPVGVPGDAGDTNPPPDVAVTLVSLHTGDCGVTPLDHAAAGKVTLTAATLTMIQGTFDVTFVSSGHFSGTFAIQSCYDITPGNYLDTTIGCVL